MSVTDGMDQVVVLAREVAELRERQARIDAERAAIDVQIADRMNRIAMAAVAAVTPAGSVPAAQAAGAAGQAMSLGAAILSVIHQRPEKMFTAVEIAGILKMTNRRGHSAIRTQLARMARSGRVAKPDYGKYQAR
ncbi:MAG TPA: hypothetical protein VNN08_14030 [Thermoanaerobaculia bacterium]|nr:hypothetical protein [Thermoanaerobaculia bacterium]